MPKKALQNGWPKAWLNHAGLTYLSENAFSKILRPRKASIISFRASTCEEGERRHQIGCHAAFNLPARLKLD